MTAHTTTPTTHDVYISMQSQASKTVCNDDLQRGQCDVQMEAMILDNEAAYQRQLESQIQKKIMEDRERHNRSVEAMMCKEASPKRPLEQTP